MEILLAGKAGFCFGVKRAINLAEECAEGSCGMISTLGPIIHNPQVVKKLEESKIYAKGSVEEIDEGTLIVRSHGVGSDEYESARKKDLKIVDATCPFVKTAQDLVSILFKDGYQVIVLGESEHPEVQGLVSYGGEGIRVITSVKELKDMPMSKKIGIVAQTTQNIKTLEEVAAFCISRCAELKVYNTICNATTLRQTESVDLASIVDVMVVVGGKNSANTKRLASICGNIQPNTHHIEVAGEIESLWFDGAAKVGVTAGASTPKWVIEEVVEHLQALN